MSTIYKETETDSRALTETFIDKLTGELHPFVELIDNDERLELCFRGNQAPNQAVIIYYKNHQMFKILDTGKISFNYNHVRYCLPEDEKKYRAKLLDLGFTIKDKYNAKGEMDIGEITRTKAGKNPLTLQEITTLVDDVLIPMFDTFFNPAMNYDYFKNCTKENKGELAEKEDQQLLFTEMCYGKSGFYFYDMEIAKKHENKKAAEDDEDNNKPDMMAVEVDPKGNPISVMLVEVKTKEAAYKGASGLNEHIRKMKNIPTEYMNDRKLEAYKIIHQYNALGLRKIENIENFTYDKMMKMKSGILVVLSREAIDYWDTYTETSPFKFEKYPLESEKFKMYRVTEE